MLTFHFIIIKRKENGNGRESHVPVKNKCKWKRNNPNYRKCRLKIWWIRCKIYQSLITNKISSQCQESDEWLLENNPIKNKPIIDR